MGVYLSRQNGSQETSPFMPQHAEITDWLQETDEARLAQLWQMAEDVARKSGGGEGPARDVIDISNICIRTCAYCEQWMGNDALLRHRMTADEIVAAARQSADAGRGEVVLQAGEDPTIEDAWMADVIRRIKRETPLKLTLSLGERPEQELVQWREAGADRYLLRFETSNRELYDAIHPPAFHKTESDRIAILHSLKTLGYETGSGVMVGIPGQSYDDLAADIELFGRLDLDLIDVGPFVLHPGTRLAQEGPPIEIAEEDQVPADEETTRKVTSLARLVCPTADVRDTIDLCVS